MTITTTVGTASRIARRAPILAVCHGGGPLPLLGEPGHAALVKSMRTKAAEILGVDEEHSRGGGRRDLKAIVVVTAHVSLLDCVWWRNHWRRVCRDFRLMDVVDGEDYDDKQCGEA